jgi:hypothetical protein
MSFGHDVGHSGSARDFWIGRFERLHVVQAAGYETVPLLPAAGIQGTVLDGDEIQARQRQPCPAASCAEWSRLYSLRKSTLPRRAPASNGYSQQERH